MRPIAPSILLACPQRIHHWRYTKISLWVNNINDLTERINIIVLVTLCCIASLVFYIFYYNSVNVNVEICAA